MSGLFTFDDNKAVLKAFYEKRDPSRVKNVEPMFLRWDEETILEAIQKKYNDIPSGWMSNGVVIGGEGRERMDSSDSESEIPSKKSTAPAGGPPISPPPNTKNAPPPPPPASAKPKIPDAASPKANLAADSKGEEEKARQELVHKAEEERNKIAEEGRKKAQAEAKQQSIAKSSVDEPEEKPAGRKTGFFGFGRKTKPAEKTPPKQSSTAAAAVPPTIKEEPVKATTASPPVASKTESPPPAPKPEPPKADAPKPPAQAVPSGGGGGGDDGGYKRPPRGSPELAKYERMKSAGLPQGAVENAMIRDGFHPAALFDDPQNNPVSAPKPVVAPPKPAPVEEAASNAIPSTPKPSPPPAAPSGGGGGNAAAIAAEKPPPGMSLMEEIKWKSAQKEKLAAAGGAPAAPSGSGGGAGGAAGISKPTSPPASASKPAAPADAKPVSSLASRQAMLAGVLGGGGGGGASAPKKDAAPPAKKWDKVSTEGGGSDTSAAASALASKLGGGAAASSNSAPPTDLSKYEKMAKMLPQGAVENAMTRDGIDPGYMFGENCITVKSDKRPIKAAGGGSTAQAPAAAPAPAPQPSISGNSMQQQHQPQMGMPQMGGFQQQAQQPMMGFQQQPQMGYSAQPHMHSSMIAPPQPSFSPRGPPPPPVVNAWVQVWSPEHNAIYYTNTQTGESSWYPPAGFQQQAPVAPVQAQPQRKIVFMVYNFNPTGVNPHEMQVFANDQIEVFSVGADGWLTGRCLRTGMMGLVPQSTSHLCLE